MCGIAGYYGSRILEAENLKRCLQQMRRRGPDYAAFQDWTTSSKQQVYLLHSRLSIIDLDPRSNQPFQRNGQSLAFNGELYNYVELRKDLEQAGITFDTQSDTEVLLRAIQQGGWDTLDRCEGMWAFAHYDEASQILTLCRDRFGEKPLYLYQDSSGMYFGSEIKFIAALLGRSLEPDTDHLCRYLVNGYKSLYKSPHAFFKGVKDVPAGHYGQLGPEKNLQLSRYWTPRWEPDDAMTFQQAVDGTRERLTEAIRLRLRADVPLAFCMSGGIDSNSLISVAKRVFHYDVHGFTIANSDSRYEEQDMVNHAVQELGIRHTSIPVQTTQFIPRLRELIRYHDAPVYTITYYAHWLLMESIAGQGYRISISGTAADELFSGYYDHHLAYLYEIRNDEALWKSSRASWQQHIQPIVRNRFLGNPDLFIENPKFRDHIYLDAEDFAGYLKIPWAEPFTESALAESLLRNRMMNELFHENIPVILHEDDLNAMYYSVENRSPFLDRRLFDFSGRIPDRHLVRDGRAKAVLRESMRGIVPDRILDNRRKVGFNAPIFSFLDVHDPAVRDYLLNDSPIYDYIRRERIESLIHKDDLPNSESKFLFYFLNAKIFLEEFACVTASSV